MLITSPRTGSNLLQKILSAQEGFRHSNYVFFDICMKLSFELLNKGRAKDVDPKVWDEYMTEYQRNFGQLLEKIETNRQEGFATFHKEHISFLVDPIFLFKKAYPDDEGSRFVVRYPDGRDVKPKQTSCLLLPDDFLLGTVPVMLIRHPAKIIASLFRAQQDVGFDVLAPHMQVFIGLEWMLQLHEWYCDHGITPVIIDANDVMTEPRVLEKLCERCDMEPDQSEYRQQRIVM